MVNEYIKRVQLHCVSYSLPDFISVTEGLRSYYTGKGGGVGGRMVHSHSAIFRMHMYRYYRSFQDGMAAE